MSWDAPENDNHVADLHEQNGAVRGKMTRLGMEGFHGQKAINTTESRSQIEQGIVGVMVT